VLAELCGYTRERLGELVAAGVFGDPPAGADPASRDARAGLPA